MRIIILIYLITTNLFANSVVDSLVGQISNFQSIHSKLLSRSAYISEQWQVYDSLRKIATDKDLIELVKHKNTIVKCYAFQALVMNNSINVFPTLVNNLYDTTKIHVAVGCVGDYIFAGDFMINLTKEVPFEESNFKLTKKQKATLDSLLFFDPNIKLSHRYEIIRNLEHNKKYHKRLNDLFYNESISVALIPLSKFKHKKEHISINQKLTVKNIQEINIGLIATINNPNEKFYDNILHVFELCKNNIIRQKYTKYLVCSSLLNYSKSKKMIRNLINTDKKNEIIKLFWYANQKKTNRNFDKIISEINISEIEKKELSEEMKDYKNVSLY